MKKFTLLVSLVMLFAFAKVGWGQNLVTNPGFETWTGNVPNGWMGSKSSITAANVVQYSTSVHGGSYACKLINETTNHKRFTTQGISVTALTVYTIKFWARGHGDVRTALWDGAYGTYNSYINVNSAIWTQYTQTVTAASTNSAAEFIFSVVNTNADLDDLQLDDVEITAPSAPTINKAYTINSTAIDVLYGLDITSVNTSNYTLTGTSTITFSGATIDGTNTKLVHLTGASATITGDATLDNIADAANSTNYDFYAGIVPISCVNANNPGGTMDNTHIATFEGIVSVNDANNNVWVSDAAGAYHGVMIYDYNFDALVAAGDQIRFTAKRSLYNNLTELTTPVLISTISSGNTPYGPTTIPGSDIDETLAANTNPGEQWEGQLVKIENFTVISLDATNKEYRCSWISGGTTYYFTIGDNVDFGFATTALTIGSTYNATGVVDWLSATSHYRLNPRTASDITAYNPVTFNVDMSTATGFIPGTDVVYLAGSFPGAAWNEPGTNPDFLMSQVGSTLIYTLTLQLPADTYQYKYFKNGSWFYGEWDGNPNRILNVSGTTTTNDVWALYNSTTWTGAVDSDWANAGNWTNNVPYDGLNVTIPAGLTNYPVLTANGSCQNITIASGASLLDGGFLTVAGTATVQQTIEGALVGTNDKWHLISQPVASILASDVFTYCYLKEFNELTGLYANIPGGTTLSAVGKGYSTMYSYESGAPTSKVLEFTGALNTGVQSVALTYTSGMGDGWNLVGNPYPSAIDWDAVTGWTKPPITEMNNGVYYWDNSITNYRYYLNGGSVNGGTNIIPAMQGFFVKATAIPTTNLGFANGIRVNNTTPAFYKSETTNPFLRLQVTNGNYSDETVVRFDANATSGADNAYDAWKLFADNVPQLYTSLDNNVDLAINTLPSVENSSILPLNFKAGVTGNFTINATEILNFDAAPVMLTDNVLNVTQNLCVNPVYTFTANANDNSDRFTLRFKSSTGIGENDKQNVKIYANGNTIFINPGTTKLQGEVIVYDILGNQIVKNHLNNESSVYSISLNNPMGYYMVKLISAQGVYTQKVFIK